jgi:hypothetical protein
VFPDDPERALPNNGEAYTEIRSRAAQGCRLVFLFARDNIRVQTTK